MAGASAAPSLSSLSSLSEAASSEGEETSSTDNVPDLPSPLADDSSSASSASSTGTIRPFFPPRTTPRKQRGAALAPAPWNAFFSLSLSLPSPATSSTHHVYLTPPAPSGVLFITHHGAGSSGLSFAALATAIRALAPTAGILSLDARGHGLTTTADDADLSLRTLADDFERVVELARAHVGWAALPDCVLVGHSLGGAVVAEVAVRGTLGAAVLGYAVLDVVEGSARDALASMATYLATRPGAFESVERAIEWHTRTRTLRNPASACVSVPALLEESGPDAVTWRTDLRATQPFWDGWFEGLSAKFLAGRGGKLLMLAGTDRLDKELMIGQMQGKYQLVVLPECGHFLHEDAPEKTAEALVAFWRRNDRAALVLPPKVGEAGFGLGGGKAG